MSSLDTKNNRDEAFTSLINGLSWCFYNPDLAIKKYPAMTYGSCDLDFDQVTATLKNGLYGDTELDEIEQANFKNRAAMVWRDAALFSTRTTEGPEYLQWDDKSVCVPHLRFFYYRDAWKTIEVVNDITMGVEVNQRIMVKGYKTLDDAMRRKLIIFKVKDRAFKCMIWRMMDLVATDLGQRFYDVRYSAIDFCCTSGTTKYFDVNFVDELVGGMPNCSIIKWDQRHIEMQLKSRIGQITQSNKHLHSDIATAKAMREIVLEGLKEWIHTPNHEPGEDPMNQVQIIWRGNVFPISDFESHNKPDEKLRRIIRTIEDIVAANPIDHEGDGRMDGKEALKRRLTIVYRKPSFDRLYVSNYTFMTCTVEEFIHSPAFLLLDEYLRCAYRILMS